MKKNLLLFAFIGLFGASLNAQLEFTLVGTTTVVNGTNQTFDVANTDFVHLDVTVKNTSTAQGAYVVSRKLINAPSAVWYEQICWGNASGGLCVDTTSATVLVNLTGSITINPDATGLLNVKIAPDLLSGAPAQYRLYIGQQGDLYMDSVDITINSVLAVKEIKKDISLSVSPNPASENVKIQVSNFESGNMKIVDVLGNVVANTSFSGSKTLNVADFKNGVYFIMISGEGMKSINRKLVVRH